MKLSIEEIKTRLPHRYPFLMIDRIVEVGKGYCVAIKNITYNECIFLGHFPKQSIMPGTLIAESMAQAAAFVGKDEEQDLTDKEATKTPEKGFLVAMNVKFQQPVIPGDQLIIKVRHIKTFGELMTFSGEAFVDKELMAKGQFSVLMMQ